MTLDALLGIVVMIVCMVSYAALLTKVAVVKRPEGLPLVIREDGTGMDRLMWRLRYSEATSR